MKVLAINGSPRPNGNTSLLIETALLPLRKAGMETETHSLAGKNIHGCIACMGCKSQPPEKPRCIHDEKDDFAGLVAKFLAADAILLGSPVYFGSATPELMALLHRVGYCIRQTRIHHLKGKVGAAVVVGRRAGHNFTLAQINYFFQINSMIMPSSTYWNIATAGAPGDVKNDAEGMATMTALGENMAALLKALKK